VFLFAVGACYLMGPDALPCTRAAETGSLSDEVRCAAGHASALGGGCNVPPRRPRADGAVHGRPRDTNFVPSLRRLSYSFRTLGGCSVVPRLSRADGGLILPPPIDAYCTGTAVIELSFPSPGLAAVWCIVVREPTGRYTASPELRPLYRH
jgi:hypothetical protein